VAFPAGARRLPSQSWIIRLAGRTAERHNSPDSVAGPDGLPGQAAARGGGRKLREALTRVDELNSEERKAALIEIERLREEHRDLDAAISALSTLQLGDQIQMQRLKKRKLGLRDRIGHLEDQLTPDIIA
jgi:hypothetical protein